jgi:hypothetical protein
MMWPGEKLILKTCRSLPLLHPTSPNRYLSLTSQMQQRNADVQAGQDFTLDNVGINN